MSCSNCGKSGSKVCSRCRCVTYCSSDCQAANWPRHKAVCRPDANGAQSSTGAVAGDVGPLPSVFLAKFLAADQIWTLSEQDEGHQKQQGYPCERILPLFDIGKLVGLTPKEEKRWQKMMPLAFEAQRSMLKIGQGQSVFVDKATFRSNFSLFSSRMFDPAVAEPNLFQNLLIAGGAVLCCLIPADPRYRRLKPFPPYEDAWEHNFLPVGANGMIDTETPIDRTLESYFREVRWPSSDIDW